MSFLTRMLAAANPLDDRYYSNEPYGALSVAGVPVSADGALKLSTVWACDRLLSETIGSLPALVFERLADGGRKRAINHPLYDVLHRAPNAYQTPIEFYDFLTHSAIMRGNGFARIKAGPRGFADQLIPIHPDHVRMEKLVGGGLRYRVQEPGKPPEVLGDDEVLHVKGMSADGATGQSVISYARDSLGLGLAAERYGARFFRNNAKPGGVLQVAGKLSPEAAKRLKESWGSAQGGENIESVAVLEEGLTWKEVGLTNKDSQFLESREFQAEDVCRWFRVPPHMVGLTSKVTSWGSGIEQLGIGFVVYTLMPWLVRWQQAITRDLILAPDKYFVEFLVDALLRGDLKGRYDAYAIGVDKGWLSSNEVRQMENLNPRDGGDAYASPPGAAAPAMAQTPPAHYAALLRATAERIARKEAAALAKMFKDGGDYDWRAGKVFLDDHAAFVASALGVPMELAERYVATRRDKEIPLAGSWEGWEADSVAALVALVEAA